MNRAVIGYIYDESTSTIKLPVTSTQAVLNAEGKNVDEIIANLQPVSTVLIITTSAGLTLSSGTNRLEVKVLRDGQDVTDQCEDSDFVWTRSEAEWLRHDTTGKTLTIGPTDLVNEHATFICTLRHTVSEDLVWEAVSSIIIDGSFHDNIDLAGWIQSSLPFTVVKNGDTLTPDWTVNRLVLTPVIYKAGNDEDLNLTRITARSWYRRKTGEISWTQVVSGQNGENINPTSGVLTVSKNKLNDEDVACEYRYDCRYYDNETGKSLLYSMLICFTLVKDGIDGQNGEDGADGQNGQDGQDGIGIKSIVQTKRSYEDDGDNEWTLTKTNNEVSKFYVRNGSKGSDGVDGHNGWTRTMVNLYRRSARPLTRADIDFGTLTYDVNTNSLLEVSHGQINQWFTAPIAGTSSLWNIFVVVYTQEDQVVLNPADWSTPVILSEAGTTGQPGDTTAFVTLYQRADETPVMPYNNISYNFQTHQISEPRDEHGELLPWTINVPANNGKTLWCITAVAQGQGESDVIAASEWCEPVELVKNGTDGRNGTDGTDGKDGTDGAPGVDGRDGVDGADGEDGVDGEDGKSAYEIAVEHGYPGTEEEWLLELHTELRFQYAVIAGEYDYIRSYGPGENSAYGYIDGVGYGLEVTWSNECPLNVPDGSYIWLRAKNTYSDYWQYVRLTGKTGTSGGFGNPTASLVEDGGEPSVEVNASGTSQAKIFDFIFKNLKGRGIQSVSYFWAVTETQEQPALIDIIETEIPQMSSHYKYLWKKTVELCTDGSEITYADLVGIYGDQGEPGTPGADGQSVTISSISYGVSSTSSSYPTVWTQAIPQVNQKQYLWTRLIYSNGEISYSYVYQPVDADSFYVTKQYALSQSNSSAPSSGWTDSIAENWSAGQYIWSKEVRHYNDGSETASVAVYDKELTDEFLLRSYFKVSFSQKNYLSVSDSMETHIIPITLESKGYAGVLSMSTDTGQFCSYDNDSWIDLGNSISLNISNNSENKDCALKIPMGSNNICTVQSTLIYEQNTLTYTDQIIPVRLS